MSRRLIIGLVAVLAGCGGHTAPPPHRAVDLVPFDGSPPAALAQPPATTTAAPCRAAALAVEGDGLLLVPGTQQGGTGGVVLINRGPDRCRLVGRPSVRFVGGRGAPEQRQRALETDPLVFPKVAPPADSLRALAPGQGALLSIDWENWCPRASVAARQAGIQPPKALRVMLPEDGGSIDVPYNAVVPCQHEDQPSIIGVRPFTPRPLQARDGFTTAPMTATVHRLDGRPGALRGRRGQELRFAVELRNASSTDTVRFDRCPLIAEKFAPTGPTEPHQLNCDAAGEIKPGAARWFEMRVTVPRDAPLGPNGLFWRLDPAGEFAPQAVARVVVE